MFNSNKTNKYWRLTENAIPSMANFVILMATNKSGIVKGKLSIAVRVKLPPALAEMPAIRVKIEENPKEVRNKAMQKVNLSSMRSPINIANKIKLRKLTTVSKMELYKIFERITNLGL